MFYLPGRLERGAPFPATGHLPRFRWLVIFARGLGPMLCLWRSLAFGRPRPTWGRRLQKFGRAFTSGISFGSIAEPYSPDGWAIMIITCCRRAPAAGAGRPETFGSNPMETVRQTRDDVIGRALQIKIRALCVAPITASAPPKKKKHPRDHHRTCRPISCRRRRLCRQMGYDLSLTRSPGFGAEFKHSARGDVRCPRAFTSSIPARAIALT